MYRIGFVCQHNCSLIIIIIVSIQIGNARRVERIGRERERKEFVAVARLNQEREREEKRRSAKKNVTRSLLTLRNIECMLLRRLPVVSLVFNRKRFSITLHSYFASLSLFIRSLRNMAIDLNRYS